MTLTTNSPEDKHIILYTFIVPQKYFHLFKKHFRNKLDMIDSIYRVETLGHLKEIIFYVDPEVDSVTDEELPSMKQDISSAVNKVRRKWKRFIRKHKRKQLNIQ
jgi:hypothetical protein